MGRYQGESAHAVLITGGAGFIGSNLAARLLAELPDSRIVLFDNLSRRGSEHNIRWLKQLPSASRLEIVQGDVRNAQQVVAAARDVSEIYHLAAQVAVTTSVRDPLEDFETNALGTFHVLEAARRSGRHPLVLFTSTNKVYGALESVEVEPAGTRYRATEPAFEGADEKTPLDFHSPYGCSKGAADQYVRDYARIYDLPTVVFRMSCIAGPRQFGNEDQGWVAHFLYSVLSKSPINIYGDGLQVRDILHVDDLLDAMLAVRQQVSATEGEIFNVGGGLDRSFSVAEILERIEQRTGLACRRTHSEVRPGDQPLYISNCAKLKSRTGWSPHRSIDQILDSIENFWRANKALIAAGGSAAAGRRGSAVEDLVAEEVA